MTRPRTYDILAKKEAGEEWYCFEAPEEFHVWLLNHPWRPDSFRDYGVSLLSLTVRSATPTGEEDRHRYNRRSPLRLDCGIEVNKGYYQTTQTKTAKFRMRVSGPRETEEALSELSQKTGLETWEVWEMTIYNSKEGVEAEFKRHNPDGTGTSLYFYRASWADRSLLYPDIPLNEQQRIVGRFQNRLAHCTAEEMKQIAFSCALKKKISPKQIKVRRKS